MPTPLIAKAVECMDKKERQKLSNALKLLLTKILNSNGLKTFGICRSCKYNLNTEEGYFCQLLKQPLSNDDVEKICKEHINLVR